MRVTELRMKWTSCSNRDRRYLQQELRKLKCSHSFLNPQLTGGQLIQFGIGVCRLRQKPIVQGHQRRQKPTRHLIEEAWVFILDAWKRAILLLSRMQYPIVIFLVPISFSPSDFCDNNTMPVAHAPSRTLALLAVAGIGAYSLQRYFSRTALAESPQEPPVYFGGGGMNLTSLRLYSVQIVNHNTKRLLFELPDKDARCGLSLTC